MHGRSIRVRGVVQGVGFRPFIAQLAKQHHLNGQVWNDCNGVKIHIWGSLVSLQQFEADISLQPPLLANIQSIESHPLTEPCHNESFEIIKSQTGNSATGIAPDASTCAACLLDIHNPDSRHFCYPFTNCTHCGPRLSIIHNIPYDRKNTCMSVFNMCDTCLSEYQNPQHRRFHAQPNACPQCGPHLQLLNAQGESIESNDLIATAAMWIKQGKIVAIKGIGGIHLACLATHETAVQQLRTRKQRFFKPFALMARDIQQIDMYAAISTQEKEALQSVAAPVVILQQHPKHGIAPSVAPMQNTLGFMLPYTPLHHLLLAQLDVPIVLSSGNISDEPQCIHNQESQERLQHVVNGYLLHNRSIVNRLDDSVVKIMAGQIRTLRRARGYAPSSMLLPQGFQQHAPILALGGELKNTFCLLQNQQAVMSQHIGDLEHTAVHHDYRHHLDLYHKLYHFSPQIIAVDKHPNYFSTQWGQELARQQGLHIIEVQHHHAHVAACMAEHGLALGSEVLGVALDGLGMGEQSELWGGEFLHVSYTRSQRVGSIQAIPMLGGAKATYEPWRNTYAQLQAIGWKTISERFSALEMIQKLNMKPLHNIDIMIQKKINSPLASSMGRLFDAVAAALDICFESVQFEGQAAIGLEILAEKAWHTDTPSYPVLISQEEHPPRLLWADMWYALLQDLSNHVDKEDIAARFHQTVIQSIAAQACRLAKQVHCSHIVLTGGVFQNKLVLEGLQRLIQEQDIQVLIASDFPLNDGGLSLGQAIVAVAKQ